jgi:hypothetical protein
MFAHISIWGVVLAAASAMIVGMVWYSPALFGKQWRKIVGLSEKDMRQKMGAVMPVLVIASLLTAYVLSLFTVYLQSYVGNSWVMAGVDAALLAWIGFAATAIFAHGAFEPRDKKVLFINTGNRLVTLVVMGLIIGASMR